MADGRRVALAAIQLSVIRTKLTRRYVIRAITYYLSLAPLPMHYYRIPPP